MTGLEYQIQRLLDRKPIKNILGPNYVLSEMQKRRLMRLLLVYKTPKNMENMLATIGYFIKYDLTNYLGRYNRLRGTNGTSKYTQMLRYGRSYHEVYKEQSNKKIKAFSNSFLYWFNKGYSYEEALVEITKIQTERGIKASLKLKGTSLYSCRSKEFWLSRGFTDEEATEKVRKIQTTNGLDYYKKQYPLDYEQKFIERISKWYNSLVSNNDYETLCKKKGHSIEAGLLRGWTYEEATNFYLKHVEHLRNIRRVPSKISQKFCDMIAAKIPGENFYSSCNYEFCINGYRVDFYNKTHKIVIEFYGDLFHRNPKIYESTHICFNKTANEVWKYDKTRQNCIESSSLVEAFIIVWESDFRKTPDEVINQIIKGIKNGNFGKDDNN